MYSLSGFFVGLLFLLPLGLGKHTDLYTRDSPGENSGPIRRRANPYTRGLRGNGPGSIINHATNLDNQADYFVQSTHFRRSASLLARSPKKVRPSGPKKTKEKFKCPNCQESIEVESQQDSQWAEKQQATCPRCMAWLRRPVKSAVGTDWTCMYVPPKQNVAPPRVEEKKPIAQPNVKSEPSKPVSFDLDKPKKDAKGRWVSHTLEAEKHFKLEEITCLGCKERSYAIVSGSRRGDQFTKCANPSCKKEMSRPISGGDWRVVAPGTSRD